MLLKLFVSLLIILSFFKSLFYGIYEIKQDNKTAGTAMIVLSVISLILPIVIIFIY